jgi:alkaline phosphatase
MTLDEAKEALVRGEDGLPGTEDFRRYHPDPDDGASALLGLALAEHTFVVWSTGEHTSDPIPTYGRGPGAEKLRGIYPNTHIYSVVRDTLERRK